MVESPIPLLAGMEPHAGNPIIPGYYADPSLVQFDGKFYLYATIDPWGGDSLACWESSDFKSWTYRELNWPTMAACTSPTSHSAKVWAPSVVQGADGRFTMYVSVGSEVWAGVAEHPLGPWQNMLGSNPFIPGNYRPDFHMIDAEAFIDDDGTPWLYWGSGWNWQNGRCWAVQLGPDMASFAGEVRDVSPDNYFEAPFMVKRHGHYFLMYSSGRTDQDTYQVHYAVGGTPLGPFVEADNSPILVTDHAANILSPGHHAVFSLDGRDYILYHRHSIPFDPAFIGRQLCVDELVFTAEGRIENVKPTHSAPQQLRRAPNPDDLAQIPGVTVAASSSQGGLFGPERVLDGNYATRWVAASEAQEVWLQLDLGEARSFSRQELRFEYAWKAYPLSCAVSRDGADWQLLADFRTTATIGSPIVIAEGATARYIRLSFSAMGAGEDVSVFDWTVLA